MTRTLLRLHWHLTLLTTAGLVLLGATIESRWLSVFVLDDQLPNVIVLLVPLTLGGLAVHLVVNDALTLPALTAVPRRRAQALLTVPAVATVEFVLVWSSVVLTKYGADASCLCARNFALGLATACVARAALRGSGYLAAPLAWAFFGLLPGAGPMSPVLGIALAKIPPRLDLLLFASATALGPIVLLSRRHTVQVDCAG